jgi:hypothetical protein
MHEKVEAMVKVGDLWLHVAIASPHHQIRFFFLGINIFFFVGDKIIRVKYAGVESKALVWRLGRDVDGDW